MAPFRCSLPVRFDDVDHAGIVYYPRFFHYFHLTLEEFLQSRLGPRGYVELLDGDRIGFPAVSAHCDYRAPLRFGDTMDIEMSIDRLGDRSVEFRYRIYRRPEPDTDGVNAAPVLAAEGMTTSAVVDLAVFRAVSIPDRLRTLFAALT